MSEPALPAPDGAAATALDEAVGLAFRLLQGSIVVLVLLFLASGIATVAPHEVAFVQRLGSLGAEPLEPGGHPTIPLLDEVVRVDLRARRVLSGRFDVKRRAGELLDGALAADEAAGLDPRREGYVLSGDTHAVHVTLAARVTPDDPRRALLAAEDPEQVVRLLLERATVLSAAGERADGLLGDAKGDFKAAVAERLQEGLRAVDSGFAVEGVEYQRDPTPPRQVKAAFDALGAAKQSKEQLRLEAERYAAERSGAAKSEAARIQARAQAEASRIKDRARATAAVFQNYLAAWRANPRALKDRLLAEVLTEALDDVEEAFVVSKGELRLRLRRDDAARTKELEDEVLGEIGEGR
ncbi:MAG: SPFH domain-containing protein [Planctomycetota bacterium]